MTNYKLTLNVTPSDANVVTNTSDKYQAYTNTGTTIDSDYIATKTSGDTTTYITTTVPYNVLGSCKSFEFRVKFKYTSCNTRGTIVGLSSGTVSRSFHIEINGSNKYLAVFIPSGSMSAQPLYSTFTPTVDTWYYLKCGYNNASQEAYIDINETGWNDTFTRIATGTSYYFDASALSSAILFRFFQLGTNSNTWLNGSIDLKETSLICDGVKVLEPVKNQPISQATSDVRAAGGGIIVNDAIYSSGDYVGTSLSIAYTGATIQAADSWEIQTCFTYNNVSAISTCYILNTLRNYTDSTKPTVCIDTTTKVISLNIPLDSSEGQQTDSSGSYTVDEGKLYYMKVGFDGSKYYLDINDTGMDGTFTRAAEITSSTKCKQENSSITLLGSSYTSDYGPAGFVDLKQTKIYINNSLVADPTESAGYTENSVVSYTVSKAGYTTVTGSVTMDSDKTLDITLTPEGGGGTNSLHIGAAQIKKCCVGTTEVKKVYLGTILLYEK